MFYSAFYCIMKLHTGMKGERSMKTKVALMEEIRQCKNRDLNRMEVLCGDLMEIAAAENDTYAAAFANTYLADAHIVQRKHTSCIQHLKEAQAIVEEYHYHDLLLLIYNIGGIYYKSHFDEITAIKYYIDAYNLAVDTQNPDEIMMTLNNIAELFSQKNDHREALSYLTRAYDIFLQKGDCIKSQRDLIFLMNLIQMYIFTGQIQKAEDIFHTYDRQIKKYHNNVLSDAIIRLCHIYLKQARGEITDVMAEADYFLNSDFRTSTNRTVQFNYFSDIYDVMLKNKDRRRAEKLLQNMGEACLHDDIEQQLRLHLCWIQYAETFHMEDALMQSYKQYYLLQKMVTDITNRTKTESMKEKVILNHMIKEHEVIEHEKQMLETRIKIDELTRLFNRSYFIQLYNSMKNNPHVTSLAFILVDVDYFKEYNDFYGHYQGDCLLKSIARTLDETGDSRFFAARFGGDEFIVLCVNTSHDDILHYLNQVYEQLFTLHIEHKKSNVSDMATISSGFAIFDNDDTYDFETSLTLTDTALYMAKNAGRNRYIEYEAD